MKGMMVVFRRCETELARTMVETTRYVEDHIGLRRFPAMLQSIESATTITTNVTTGMWCDVCT